MTSRLSHPPTFIALALACLLVGAVVSAAGTQKAGGARRPSAPHPSAPRPDARVGKALDEMGREYKVNDYGDYILLVALENNRTQIVTVDSQVLKGKGTTPFRIVRSMAMFSPGAIPEAVKSRLIKDNAEYEPFEPWQFVKYKDGMAAEFQWFVEADCSDLEEAIDRVATDTDAMEKIITGQDEF
jgi:hypothetical protein